MNRPSNRNLKQTATQVAQVFLSLFIVYHLIVIVTLANGGSYLGRSLEKYITAYGNILGVNATWNFFSPDPAHTMYYKYVVYYEDDEGNELRPAEEGFYPPEKSSVVIDSSKRRLLYAMRFLTIDQSRIKTLLGSWLCRSHPTATRVRMEHILEQIPFLDVAAKFKTQPMAELVTQRNVISKELDCRKPPDEESL